ncbi:MAG: reverse transcriptase domain-containing protein [Thermohalobaculum sp.]
MNRPRCSGEARIRGASERGGAFWDHETGIPLGCPLSSPIGAFFLHELDRWMETSGLFDVRFMDNILVLAPTPWKPRRAVKAVNEVLGASRLEKPPDKTFIGRIERGFGFLGVPFGRAGLRRKKRLPGSPFAGDFLMG